MQGVSVNLRIGIVVGLAIFTFGCATVPQRASIRDGLPKAEEPVIVNTVGPPPKAKAKTPATKPPSSLSAAALGIYRSSGQIAASPSKGELGIIESAKSLIGMAPEAPVTIYGRRFVLDCVGTVAAIFYRERIDVTKDFASYTGTGVDRLFKSLKQQKVLHTDKYPRPGDIVIWDNTWDANENGNPNDDPRTHAGVVLAVDQDGTIHYVHENYRRGVIVEVMNLLEPTLYKDKNGKMLNSPMAMAPKPGETRSVHWVSGDLFDTFGDVLGARKHYAVAQRIEDSTPVRVVSAGSAGVDPAIANSGSRGD